MNRALIRSGILSLLVLAWASFLPSATADQTDPNSVGRNGNPNRYDSEPLSLSYADDEPTATDEPAASSETTSTYQETTTNEPEPILWKGFFWGDRHFRKAPRPIGSPLYFEDPFINSDVRMIYLYHKFPGDIALRGGDLNVYAVQIRIALTERLSFIATGDGYSHLESPVINDASGWNDLAAGVKYAAYVDHENDFLVTTGLTWRMSNGTGDTLQGNVDELRPFVSAYKKWDKFHFMANVAGRIAMDEHQGNHILNWDLHGSYEIIENVFFPLVEIHGVHYLSDADRLPFDIGGLDYSNIGSNNVAGHAAFWAGFGGRVNITDNLSWGAVFEVPLQDPSNNDLFEYRFTTNFAITF